MLFEIRITDNSCTASYGSEILERYNFNKWGKHKAIHECIKDRLSRTYPKECFDKIDNLNVTSFENECICFTMNPSVFAKNIQIIKVDFKNNFQINNRKK